MSLRRSDGQLLAEFESDANADYNVTVNTKSKNYPLSIEALGGIDLVTNNAPDFDVAGAVLERADSTIANVNPFSTIAHCRIDGSDVDSRYRNRARCDGCLASSIWCFR